MNRTMEKRGKQQRGLETQAALLDAAGRVFSQKEYDGARLKDISEEAGISLGSLYFHYGNKEDIAAAVLEVQQERMTEVLAGIMTNSESSLTRLLDLMDGIAELIASDPLVQAGIRLVSSLPEELKDSGHAPYGEWVGVTETLLKEGIEDGSVSSQIDLKVLAEYFNEVFIGAQVLAGIQDNWASLPDRVRRLRPHVVAALTRTDPA